MIENAEITSTMLGPEDHGIFTCYITVRGDGWGCCFGGYALDYYDKEKKERIPCQYGLYAIKGLMDTLEVTKWEDLKGQYVRCESDGWGGKITRIGHLLKNKWFSFDEFINKVKEMEA